MIGQGSTFVWIRTWTFNKQLERSLEDVCYTSAASHFYRHQEEVPGTLMLWDQDMDHSLTPQNLCTGSPWGYRTREHLRTDFSKGGSQFMAIYCFLDT